MEGAEILHMSMFILESDLLQRIQTCYETDLAVKELIAELWQKMLSKKHYSWTQNILRRKSKIMVPLDVYS